MRLSSMIRTCGSVALLIATTSCRREEAQRYISPPIRTATATITGRATDGKPIGGSVTLMQIEGKVKVTANVSGLMPGKHGFHIHEHGVCKGPDYKSAGSHFNPSGERHGAPTADRHHEGDLGNIEVGPSRTAKYAITSDDIRIDDSNKSVLGRALIIHQNQDDYATQPTGAAGKPVACGVLVMSPTS